MSEAFLEHGPGPEFYSATVRSGFLDLVQNRDDFPDLESAIDALLGLYAMNVFSKVVGMVCDHPDRLEELRFRRINARRAQRRQKLRVVK